MLLDAGCDVTFLAAGSDYALRPGVRVEESPNRAHPAVPAFSIVNSPALAPSLLKSDLPRGDWSQPDLEAVFEKFLSDEGPFDVINFHNLEGLTARCLTVAKRSGAKVVCTLHNYWFTCSQVNLWVSEGTRCLDYDGGRRCVTCQPKRPLLRNVVRLAKQLFSSNAPLVYASDAARIVAGWFPGIASWIGKSVRARPPSNVSEAAAAAFRDRRREILECLNTSVDVVAATSRRCYELARQYGIRDSVLTFGYVGAIPFRSQPARRIGEAHPFHLVYLGKLQEDKGADFLLDALNDLSPELRGKIYLTVAARSLTRFDLESKFAALGRTLARYRYIARYAREDLPTILENAHLGIIPSQWEDVMPLVGFEFVACRVPFLCTNRGGSGELAKDPAFVFDPDRRGDFAEKLEALVQSPALRERFWSVDRSEFDAASQLKFILALHSSSAPSETFSEEGSRSGTQLSSWGRK